MPNIEMKITYTADEILAAMEEKCTKELNMPTHGLFKASFEHTYSKEITVEFIPNGINEVVEVPDNFGDTYEQN